MAVEAGDGLLVRRFLRNWRQQGANAAGLLQASDDVPEEVVQRLRKSIGLASTAGESILAGKQPIADSCKRARVAIADCCDAIELWIGEYASRTAE